MKQEKQNKPQFNMREFLESKDYADLNNALQVEINSYPVSIVKESRSTKEAIKKAKKAYNKLISDAEAINASRKEFVEVIVNNLKKQPRFNFTLIV